MANMFKDFEEIDIKKLENYNFPGVWAMFVIGKSANGRTSWKNNQGITLKDIEELDTKGN